MSGTIKKKAIQATLWTFVRMGFEQFFAFAVFIIVARLLSPSQIGLFALAMILAELARVFAVSGFSDVVTKADHASEEEVSRAAFWGNMAMSIGCAVLMSLAAWPLSKILRVDDLAPVLVALSWSIPISAMGAIHMARQLRRFGHKSQAVRSLLSGMIGGGAAIWAAYHGFGVWSLVVQRFATDVISVLTAWHAFRWLPRFPTSPREIADILPFSVQMSISKLITSFISNIQDIAIGGGAGSAEVGLYRLARRTNDMLVKATITPLSTVSVNIFVALKNEPARFQAAFGRLLSLSCTLTFPAFFGLAAVADPLVPLVFGEKWREAVPIFQILAPICVPLVISLYVIPLLTAFGRANKATEMTIIQLAAAVIISAVAAPFGIYAVVLGLLVRTYVMIPYQLGIISHHAELPPGHILMVILRPLVSSLIMAGGCYGILQLLPGSIPPILRLCAVITGGGALYALLVFIVDRRTATWGIEMAMSKIRPGGRLTVSEAPK